MNICAVCINGRQNPTIRLAYTSKNQRIEEIPFTPSAIIQALRNDGCDFYNAYFPGVFTFVEAVTVANGTALCAAHAVYGTLATELLAPSTSTNV